ncbi:hypothetical protein A8C56_04760 [Niabella ginsenosidivorans]|uniref:Uncharacterized protein n=1 Tax=Niabella ginsenosidivorans TaxID=1176587 RepID=A0A1A9HYQ9_9BACT|nr:hypothetical protein [Niabella ginsenosidivorans]ANH80383.1 hypothetical protein A8C56_04760 [Niabella ginsenosidivorans]
MSGFLSRLAGASSSNSKVEPRLATAFESPAAAAFGEVQTVYEQSPDPVKRQMGTDAFEQPAIPLTENVSVKESLFAELLPGTVTAPVINTETGPQGNVLHPEAKGTILQPINIKKEEPVMPVIFSGVLKSEAETSGSLSPVDNNKAPFNFPETGKEAFVAGTGDQQSRYATIRPKQTFTAFSLNNTFNAFLSSGGGTEINNYSESAAPAQPVIKINIGHIDIKAVAQTPSVREARKQTPGISLDDLLKKKNK